jgi:hypothetical protein
MIFATIEFIHPYIPIASREEIYAGPPVPLSGAHEKYLCFFIEYHADLC